MATVVVFASSLFISSAIVIVKAMELKCGRRNIILEFLSRLDSTSDKLIANLKFKALQLVQSARYIVLVQMKAVCKDLLKKAEEKIISEYKKRQEAIMMGKKDIVDKGSVSFYLKKITEHKGNERKGKIE